jgi:hypothetical protein
MHEKAVRRLTVLREEAGATPVPTRKFFHIGQPEVLQDVGECIPMIAWVDDNLSRYVLSDVASTSWGRERGALLVSLPNVAVSARDGVLVITGPGRDDSVAHPGGQGRMHFVHLGLDRRLFERGIKRLYVYRLEGVQVTGLADRKPRP